MVPNPNPEKLLEAIRAGIGTRTGDAYRPWITVRKKNTSATSNQSIARMPGLKRHCHFLSRGEKDLAHTLWWLGVADVREQLPLFPWQHVHPASYVEGTRDWGDHPGMQAVAEEAGIALSLYPKIRIPVVLSLDLLANLQWPDGSFRGLVGFSCKSISEVEAEGQTPRLYERLELDRRYCVAGRFPHILAYPEKLPGRLPRELEAIAPLGTTSEIRSARQDSRYKAFTEELQRTAYSTPACVAANEAGAKVGWGHEQSGHALKLAMWSLDVDNDLTRRTNLAAPLKKGGRRVRAELRRLLLGVNDEN
jgi:hypothetical protein